MLNDPTDFLDTISQRPAATRPYYRPHYTPHRGSMILVLGIVGFFCWPCAVVGWCLGSSDLNKIDAGTMDPAGRPTTFAGTMLAAIATVLGIVAALLLMAWMAGLLAVLRSR